jgi:signal peptidase I
VQAPSHFKYRGESFLRMHKRTGAGWRAHVRRAWQYIQSDGIIPFLLQMLIAFALIKYLFFPVLGMLFGTPLPIVAVLSGSMEHGETGGFVCGMRAPDDYTKSDYWEVCGAWYEARGITQDDFNKYPFRKGFNKGDLMVIVGADRGATDVGDVIVYESRERYPIIHRVIAETNDSFATKGDYNGEQIIRYVVVDARGQASVCHNNGVPSSCANGEPVTAQAPGAVRILDETNVPKGEVLGRAVARVPYLGWIKIGVTNVLSALFF